MYQIKIKEVSYSRETSVLITKGHIFVTQKKFDIMLELLNNTKSVFPSAKHSQWYSGRKVSTRSTSAIKTRQYIVEPGFKGVWRCADGGSLYWQERIIAVDF